MPPKVCRILIEREKRVKTQYEYRDITSDETEQVVAVFHAAFGKAYVERTLYTCPGIARYLANALAAEPFALPHRIIGVWDSTMLVGFAHSRGVGAAWHLNNIAVLPAYRKQGVGNSLFDMHRKAGRELGYQRQTLDVEEANAPVRRWYESLGFVEADRSAIEEICGWASSIERERQELPTDIRVLNWESALAWQTAYGFCHFEIEANSLTWQVGQFGRFFRISTFPTSDILSVLEWIAPSKRLLLVSPTDASNTYDVPEKDRATALRGRDLMRSRLAVSLRLVAPL